MLGIELNLRQSYAKSSQANQFLQGLNEIIKGYYSGQKKKKFLGIIKILQSSIIIVGLHCFNYSLSQYIFPNQTLFVYVNRIWSDLQNY